MSQCTCQQHNRYQDNSLLQRIKELQLELEEATLSFEHKKGNLERENTMLEENIKLETQNLKDNQLLLQEVTEQMKQIKLETFKKQHENHSYIMNIHELEAQKKQLLNQIEFLKQALLHSNENVNQLTKKDEHIRLLTTKIDELDQQINTLKKM